MSNCRSYCMFFLVNSPKDSGFKNKTGCSARYVGETSRHFAMRVREHLSTDMTSHIHKHLQALESCSNLCTENNFKILDSASSVCQLKIKEALHILWEKPSLNKQDFHVNLGLLRNFHNFNNFFFSLLTNTEVFETCLTALFISIKNVLIFLKFISSLLILRSFGDKTWAFNQSERA